MRAVRPGIPKGAALPQQRPGPILNAAAIAGANSLRRQISAVFRDEGVMQSEGNTNERAGRPASGGHEITKRVALLAFLISLVLIPLYLVHDLVTERYERSQAVADEVASQWGQQQLIAG